jgi:phosphoribosylformylglycinamidine (FGAM) synthase-like enzyme
LRGCKLDNVEVSEEINAASIVIPVDVDGEEQEWLLMFKNETHNHPTEIEPFGGAATCLGGCITDRNLLIQGFFIRASVRPGLRGCRGRKGENSDFDFISTKESGF